MRFLIIFGKKHFLLISENVFFRDKKRDGITSLHGIHVIVLVYQYHLSWSFCKEGRSWLGGSCLSLVQGSIQSKLVVYWSGVLLSLQVSGLDSLERLHVVALVTLNVFGCDNMSLSAYHSLLRSLRTNTK